MEREEGFLCCRNGLVAVIMRISACAVSSARQRPVAVNNQIIAHGWLSYMLPSSKSFARSLHGLSLHSSIHSLIAPPGYTCIDSAPFC